MKGTFFAKPLEYKVDISGESWTQGQSIKGQLIVNNHSSEKIDLSGLGCHLCYCVGKKLKARDPKAIILIESAILPKGKDEMSFEFRLSETSPITESTASLYLICGDIKNPYEGGILELNIRPTEIITNFVQVFEQFFRFKLKAFKNKKEYIEAVVTPPDSPVWKSIQKMSLQMRMAGENLEVNFILAVKRISFEDISKTKDEKIQISKTLTKKDHTLYGSINHEGIQKIITEVLDGVRVKPIL